MAVAIAGLVRGAAVRAAERGVERGTRGCAAMRRELRAEDEQ